MNYYEELGLTKNASEKEIKQAFRKLAKENHPDKTNGDKIKEEKFKKINEAYQTLSDPEQKAQYDAMLSSGFSNKNFHEYARGNNGGQRAYTEADFANIFGDDFFSQFFSEGAQAAYGKNRQQKKRELSLSLNVSFIEAIQGCTKIVYVPEEIMLGNVKTNIKIPPGANNGDEFLITVKGVSFTINLKVGCSTEYTRDGLDLTRTLKVPLTTAILGGSVKFNHFGKDMEVNIPVSSNSGSKLRLKGLGVEKNGVKGNLILNLNIVMPKNLTDKQIKLMKEFGEIEAKK